MSFDAGALTGVQNRQVFMPAIHAIVEQIAARFQPDQIILFGSYAYGQPRPESDVDLLVIMNTPRGELETALGDWFLREITIKGMVLYERHRCPTDF